MVVVVFMVLVSSVNPGGRLPDVTPQATGAMLNDSVSVSCTEYAVPTVALGTEVGKICAERAPARATNNDAAIPTEPIVLIPRNSVRWNRLLCLYVLLHREA